MLWLGNSLDSMRAGGGSDLARLEGSASRGSRFTAPQWSFSHRSSSRV